MRSLRKAVAAAVGIVIMATAVTVMPMAAFAQGDSGDTADRTEVITDMAKIASYGLDVEKHTQSDIIKFISDRGLRLDEKVEYKTAYSDTAPYAAGELTDKTLESALDMLNSVRYIAGIGHEVTLDDTFNKECQAGALIGKVTGKLTHYPDTVDGMSDELFQLAYDGCSQSNIAMGYSTINDCIIHGWMSDDDSGNIQRVGHRFWCLNPSMGKTGFGAVGKWMNMHSIDQSSYAQVKNIAWPAQVMPVEYFYKWIPWSIFTGENEDVSAVQVKLTRKSDGKVWNFSSTSADGQFYVTNYSDNGLGNGTIVFLPDGIDAYNDGDEFDVQVTGVKKPLSYTVSFFTLGEAGHTHSFSSLQKITPDLEKGTAVAELKCSCGKTEKVQADIEIITENVTCGFKGYVYYNYTIPVGNGSLYGYNYVYVDSVPHKYGAYKYNNDATCTKAGTKTAVCEYGCGTEKTVTDTKHPALGHSYGGWILGKAAQPGSDGFRVRKCTRCKQQSADRKTISKIGAVTLKNSVYTYDGKAHEPAVVVKNGSNRVIGSSNYTVSYSVNTNVGTASAVITFRGSYSGEVKKTFVIRPAAVNVTGVTSASGGVKVSWNKSRAGASYIIYRRAGNGSFKKLKTITGTKTTSYIDRSAKNGAKYSYKITAYKKVGKTVYKAPAGAAKTTVYTAAVKIASVKNTAKQQMTVKWSENSKATGYQLQYSTKSSFKGAKTVRVKGARNVSKVVRGLAKGRKYYVRVRSYKVSGGKTYCSVWSGRKAVSTRK